MKPVYDIILREWAGEWMPIIKVQAEEDSYKEEYRGEYQSTPERALGKALDILQKIRLEEERS